MACCERVLFDAALVDRVEHHAKALSLSTRRMPSGAGHDAQMMQRICPTAMIFVPSVAGLSHNVKEHTEAGELVAGPQVLMNLVMALGEGQTPPHLNGGVAGFFADGEAPPRDRHPPPP